MPKVLDDCVKKVKAGLIKDGLSDKDAESRAWAICKKQKDMVRKFGEEIMDLINNYQKEL